MNEFLRNRLRRYYEWRLNASRRGDFRARRKADIALAVIYTSLAWAALAWLAFKIYSSL